MNLDEFLKHLKNVSGHAGQYTAVCPAHDDKHASLSVSSGKDGKIILKCHAGCSTEKVLAAMGLKMSDLFPGKAESAGKKKITAVYEYQNESGETVYQKVRYEPKGFSCRRPGTDGWIYSLTGIKKVLYRLPQLIKAVKNGKTVYVAEGEKDVETMTKLGRTATCNFDGAGEHKWKKGYGRFFRNAAVVILPDNDETGKKFSVSIAENLCETAKSVKLLDLTKEWPDLPEHGDVSDIAVKDEKFLKKLDDLTEKTPEYKPASSKSTCDPDYAALFYGSDYTVIDGCINAINTKGLFPHSEKICNFIPVCTREKNVDDGTEIKKVLTITGKCAGGLNLPEIDVPASEFCSMNWITEKWGILCNLNPGYKVKDMLRHCIQQISKDVKIENVYTCTGWKHMDGKWIYLHGGGSIGAGNISVRLRDKLSNYVFPEAGYEDLKKAVKISQSIYKVAPHEIIMPLMALTFLSPLNEFLKQAGHEPKFVYYLVGKTGSFKSTLAALFLSFFGRFTNTNLPMSFLDTANSIIYLTSLCKDNLTCIDDFKPSSSKDVARMNNVFQTVLRSYGERTGRNRLTAGSTLMRQRFPEGNVIVTGEQFPDVGQSGVARCIYTQLKKGDVNTENLTIAQKLAGIGVFSLCMRAYIEWIYKAVNSDEKNFIKSLSDCFISSNNLFAEVLDKTGIHPRATEALVHLYIGWSYYTNFMVDLGVIKEDIKAQLDDKMKEILIGMGKAHAQMLADEKPTHIFINSIRAMIQSESVFVKNMLEPKDTPSEDGIPDFDKEEDSSRVHNPECLPFVGYMDDNYYYFTYRKVYAEVRKFCSAQGISFTCEQSALKSQLAEEKLIVTENESNTVRKTICGKQYRYLAIERNIIDYCWDDPEFPIKSEPNK